MPNQDPEMTIKKKRIVMKIQSKLSKSRRRKKKKWIENWRKEVQDLVTLMKQNLSAGIESLKKRKRSFLDSSEGTRRA